MNKTVFNSAIVAQDTKTEDFTASFFKTDPPSGAANFLYSFRDENGHTVSVHAELNTFEARREILRFVRKKFGTLHPDAETEKKLEQMEYKEIRGKLSQEELDEVELKINKAKKKKPMTQEDEDWMRFDLMLQTDMKRDAKKDHSTRNIIIAFVIFLVIFLLLKSILK